MTVIQLDPGEALAAHQVAALRNYVNAGRRIQNRRQDTTAGSTKLNVVGFLGELAFAKWRGVFPDLTAHPRAGVPDFTIDGQTYDIKATDHPEGNLICYEGAQSTAKFYVLALVRATANGYGYNVEFPGWTTGADLIRPERRVKLRTWCYLVPRNELSPWKEAAA